MPLVYIPDEVYDSSKVEAMLDSFSAESVRGRNSRNSSESTRERANGRRQERSRSIPRAHYVASHNNRHENRQSRSEARGYQQAMGSTDTSGKQEDTNKQWDQPIQAAGQGPYITGATAMRRTVRVRLDQPTIHLSRM